MKPAYSLSDLSEILGVNKFTLSGAIAACTVKKIRTPHVRFYKTPGGRHGKGRNPYYDKEDFLNWWECFKYPEIQDAITLLEKSGYQVIKASPSKEHTGTTAMLEATGQQFPDA